MLVLTRKRQQQIRIGDHVTLTILRIKGNTVRVGIEAPRHVRVIRGELPPKTSRAGQQDPRENQEIHTEIGGDATQQFETLSGPEEQHAESHRLQLALQLLDSEKAVASAV